MSEIVCVGPEIEKRHSVSGPDLKRQKLENRRKRQKPRKRWHFLVLTREAGTEKTAGNVLDAFPLRQAS
jgi:hypothetical protein